MLCFLTFHSYYYFFHGSFLSQKCVSASLPILFALACRKPALCFAAMGRESRARFFVAVFSFCECVNGIRTMHFFLKFLSNPFFCYCRYCVKAQKKRNLHTHTRTKEKLKETVFHVVAAFLFFRQSTTVYSHGEGAKGREEQRKNVLFLSTHCDRLLELPCAS